MRALRLPAYAFPVTYLVRFRFLHDLRSSRTLRSAPVRKETPHRARIVVQPVIPLARLTHRVDVSRSSQVPRQSILCLCSGPRPRPNRRSLATGGPVGAAPARETAKAPALMDIGATTGLQHLLSTLHEWCCHHHMQDSLPAGWLAFTGRELNPLDCVERFPSSTSLPPFLDLA